VKNGVIKDDVSALNKKKLMNCGPLARKLHACMFTYPKSTLHVLHMLMHLSSRHVTLLPRKFHHPLRIFPQLEC